MQKFLLPLNMFKPTVFLFFMVSAVSSQAQDQSQCIDRHVFDGNGLNLNKHCCQDSNGQTKFADLARNQHCCDGANHPIFDSQHYMCHRSIVIPKQPNLFQCEPYKVCEIKPDCTSNNTRCCGGSLLDENHLCNECGTMIRKMEPSHNSVCSRLMTYNSNTHVCLNGHIEPLPRTTVAGICGSNSQAAGDLCCFGKLYENALLLYRNPTCCGDKLVRDDEICCRSLVYTKQPGYQCFTVGPCAGRYESRQKCGSYMAPLLLYWYKVTSVNHKNQTKFCSSGTLLTQDENKTSLEVLVPNFCLKIRPCKKLTKGKWYVIISKKRLDSRSHFLKIKNRKNVFKVSRSTQKYLTSTLVLRKKYNS